MDIQSRWLEYAQKKATGSQFNKTTILDDGQGQTAGAVAEMAFGRWLKDHGIDFTYTADTSYAHDFLVDGLKVDVKAKQCTSTPQPHYTVHVTASQKNHDADAYVFARVSDKSIWLLGWTLKQDFWESDLAADVQAGQVMDGMTQRADARRIEIRHLSEMTSILIAVGPQVPVKTKEIIRTATSDWIKAYEGVYTVNQSDI